VNSQGRYHHGDLPAALLAAVAEIVRDGGIAAVTLREAARRAGVSHAAPAHHFGDKAGLLTAFAIQGCEMMRAALGEALRRVADARDESPMLAIGLAYIRFAIDHPEHFAVMFRTEYIRADDEAYRNAREHARAPLIDSIRAVRADLTADDPRLLYAATGAWSLVHGFATLWLHGNLEPGITSRPPEEAAADTLRAWGETLFAKAGLPPTPMAGSADG
jgi:AcrR family transcriptional regulator